MKRKKNPLRILVLALAFLVFGCAGGAHHSLVPDYQSKTPRTIAVLPVLNETVNLKAPEVFRPIIQNRLSQKGYEIPAISTVDGKLLEKEIREAGQINTLTPQEMGALLGTDALLYATVTEFNTTYLVAYSSMTVGARFWLVDSKTGEKIWESDHQVKESKLGLDSKSMQDALSFAAVQSYKPYAEQVVDTSLATLPNGPLAVAPASGGCLLPAAK
ncbi:MAG: DUF799 family lipoprotein [Deltaproteobacteria bacterium]|nr:DUF799 family lipoprotein [Deltaproteobacteria bacterium]